MKYTNPGEMFIERSRPPTASEDVLRYARFLREEAELSSEPPIDLTQIYERFGIPLPKRTPLPNIQGLTPNPERGIILINETDLPLRQRFSEGHELIELLFSALPEGKGWAVRRKAGVFNLDVKERLCNEGAAELLMPRDSFLPRICALGVSYQTAHQLAAEYSVSTTAALVQIARVGPGSHAVVLWRMKNKPTELLNATPANQLSLFGDFSPSLPHKKLRVEWAMSGRGAPFIPRHKSTPTDSSVYEAWRDGVFKTGEDHLDLGSIIGLFRCESQPFEVDGERQVLSLLHPQGDVACSQDRGLS